MPWGEAGMWRDFLNDFNGKIPICLGNFAVILVEAGMISVGKIIVATGHSEDFFATHLQRPALG